MKYIALIDQTAKTIALQEEVSEDLFSARLPALRLHAELHERDAGQKLMVYHGDTPFAFPTPEEIAAQEAVNEEAEVKARLREIDIASIRSIREYIAQKADAPQYIKDYENAAKAEREKLPKAGV